MQWAGGGCGFSMTGRTNFGQTEDRRRVLLFYHRVSSGRYCKRKLLPLVRQELLAPLARRVKPDPQAPPARQALKALLDLPDPPLLSM